MPIRIYPHDIALQNRKENRYSRWSAGQPDAQLDMPNLASRRIGAPFLETVTKSRVKIDPGGGIYAVGSCFAREIENAFKARGLSILSRDKSLAKDRLFSRDGHVREGYYNRFSAPSMLLDFEVALGVRKLGKTDLMFEVEPGLYIDMHYTHVFAPAPLDVCLHRRRAMQALVRRVRNARTIFVTLGLNEVWFDVKTGLYMNVAPRVAWGASNSTYQCHVLTVAENVAALSGMHALLTRTIGPDFNLWVTVSPVPFDLTFSPDDAIVANSESKSILRAAAAEFCAMHDNVHYFASYEIAMYSDRATTFKQDQRHVTGPSVSHITELFIRDILAAPTGPTQPDRGRS